MSDNTIQRLPTYEAYNELLRAYDFFNAQLFAGKLPSCLITLQREKRTLGYHSPKRFVDRDSGIQIDEIAMNPSYFSIRTIKDSLSTLVHEMVHLQQTYFGKPGRRGYHNLEWANLMEKVGLMPSDTGEPGGARRGQHMSHYIVAGGPFDNACDELTDLEFTLSWMDRFPPYQPKTKKPISPDGKGFIDDESPYDAEDLEDGEPELDDEIADALKFVNPPPKEPVNKSNRCKYRCPVCKTNVWGKPEIVVFCGGTDCEKAEFILVEK